MTKNGALFVRESIEALLNVPFFNCSHISSAILFSIAAPTKNISRYLLEMTVARNKTAYQIPVMC